MRERYIGIDAGAETIKVVELTREGGELRWTGRKITEHHKEPGAAILRLLSRLGWDAVRGAAVSGRLSRQVDLLRVPTKQAQTKAYRFLHTDDSATVVSIGSHGFSVLELRPSGIEVFRENSRCSQGTGNFLRQLVERFGLTIEEASALCHDVGDPAPLSGRCPVILKTDMTHLANKGESRSRILAGLYDAVCENVQVLIKPRISPPKVVLIGGVSRANRIHEHFRAFLGRHQMALAPTEEDDALYFEALGAAVLAAEEPTAPPPLEDLLATAPEANLERLPPLSSFLDQVQRMPRSPSVAIAKEEDRRLVLGFDIGSTGSKAVALDRITREVVWEGYTNTNGDPVGAARGLMKQFAHGEASQHPLITVGATGSGREIVGSLLSTCYGASRVYILNEIAAHAEGALHFDPRVDTIFEIGGQDAKYIRLDQGRVVDAAMNEACSAGTGSFIEEQGRKFSGIEDVVHLGQEALAAECGISLGQHCSVFMAEIIGEAVSAGEEQRAIIAGIYDSIIQNYLNRVKGSRSVGQVIFCQGMPFSSDALAAAVSRQTGSTVIIPPNPGTVGALGIALLTCRELPLTEQAPLDPALFLAAEVLRKDTFVCKSVQGCGGSGNKCRIDRLSTRVEGKRQRFTWGGGCSLYDKGTGKRKLPDLAPDPFREREELVQQVVRNVGVAGGRPRVALSDEFLLKGLFPFFATFIHRLGFDIVAHTGADQRALKRGIEEANVPFCAPMQQFHGLVSAMAEDRPDYLFLPMLRGIPRVGEEKNAKLCPIVQASPDMLRWDLGAMEGTTIIDPVIDIGPDNLESGAFLDGCCRTAQALGVMDRNLWRDAYRDALAVQTRFDVRCVELGRRALTFCEERGVVPVVILGRVYTIYNTVLNSNVPALMREQGALPIPVDCYPLQQDVPIFNDVYWGYGHRNLRAAHQVRRSERTYSLFCSNYSCGPDSFVIHFYSYMMEGRPFSVIETDGHSGDAGTKTRIEAFLYCVHQDLQQQKPSQRPHNLKQIEWDKESLEDVHQRNELMMIPRMGPGAVSLAACFRGLGIKAECLPLPDRETVRLGRRHTSGKECVPMCITLGSLLQRLEPEQDSEDLFSFFMPKSHGPCRFGQYNVLYKIILQRLGWGDRVRVWSPEDTGYFEGVPSGWFFLTYIGFMVEDMLLEALYSVRPRETRPGAAFAIYDRYRRRVHRLLEEAVQADLTISTALLQVGTGRLYGFMDLLRDAATELKAVTRPVELPKVLVVGEIYVRCDPFANDFIIEKLEQRGIQCTFAPFTEWLEYTNYINFKSGAQGGLQEHVKAGIQARIQSLCYKAVADIMGWHSRTTVKQTVDAAAPYMRNDLHGEAVLTIGGPVHEWREGQIDGVVSVGPLECMPNKICEAQFFHIAEEEGLASLTLSLNGDPLDQEVVDNFAFEVHSRHRQGVRATPPPMPQWLQQSSRLLGELAAKANNIRGERTPPAQGPKDQEHPPIVLEQRPRRPSALQAPLSMLTKGLAVTTRRRPN